MKSPRIRILSVSLSLAAAPFMGAAFSTPVRAADIVAQASAGESVYGLAARLPKDTEAFASLYRLSDLADGFLKSNFVKKVMANETLVREMDLDDIKTALENDPQVKNYAQLAKDVLGGELMIAMPAGFTESMAAMMKQLPLIQVGFFTARTQVLPPDGQGDQPPRGPGMPKEMLPVVEAVAELNVPPLILALKAGAQKDTLKALLGQAMNEIPGEVMEKMEQGKFEAGGGSFESMTIKVGKMMPEREQEQMKSALSEAAGEEKGAALVKKLLAKQVEISWGWVGDYLVVGIGADHSHVKFTSAADSVLTHPDVATRAAEFAAKKPFGFTYTSQKMLHSVNELGGVFDMLISLADTAKKASVPVNLDNVIKELKELDTKSDALWPNDPDAAVGALWWDGGLHAESFGGPKSRANENSRPLTLTSLASDKTLITIGGRSNGPFRDKIFTYIEDLTVSIWSIYQKDVKAMMPDDVRQGAAMGEMMGVPMVKELWKSLQSFRAAMGDESVMLLNLDGVMPEVPGSPIPPDVVAKGRIPRLAWVSELKDRAKLAESWAGLKTLIGSAAAIAAAQTGEKIPTEPVSKKDGNVEMFGFELPMNLGDVWPHTAVSPTQWFMSTSPSFTKELAGKTPAAGGPACGSHIRVNFPALWNYGADWLKLLPIGPDETEMADFGLSLARSIGSLDVISGEQSAQAHSMLHWTIKDAE